MRLTVDREKSARYSLFMEKFREWDWSGLSLKVSGLLPDEVYAFAQGNTIVFSEALLRKTADKKSSGSFFATVFWHEAVHIWQQAELSCFLDQDQMRSYVRKHCRQLEADADEIARRIAGEGFPIKDLLSHSSGKKLCPALAAPAQMWMVGGFLSKITMETKVSFATLNDLREYVSMPAGMELQLYGPIAGAHETFTKDACSDLAKFNRYALPRKKINDLVKGSKFNDLRFYSNIKFAFIYLFMQDPFISQSHKGDMQFLHSMSTSERDYALDRKKVLRWTQFCLDVFNNHEKIRSLTLGKYVFEVTEQKDILRSMLASMLIAPSALSDLKAKAREKTGTVEQRQAEQARRIQRALFEENAPASEYCSMPIQDFFGGKESCGYIALGTVCHMIQDSFAASHARRAYNLLREDPLMDMSIEKIRNNRGFDSSSSHNLNQYAQKIKKNITPVLLFADYRQQSSNRHACADVFLGIYKKRFFFFNEEINAVYAATANAGLARESTALFIWMALCRKPVSEILKFIEGLYPLAETERGFFPTKAGYPYEKSPFSFWSVCLAAKYFKKILQDVGPNIIERNPQDRIVQLTQHIQILGGLLKKHCGGNWEAVYLSHLNEIAIELNALEKAVWKNPRNPHFSAVIQKITFAKEAAQKIYSLSNRQNPLLLNHLKTPSFFQKRPQSI